MEKLLDSNIQEQKYRVHIGKGDCEYVTLKEYPALLKSLAKQYEPNFKEDEHFKKVFRAIALYNLNDARFESEGYGSLNKGLFITGNVGTGKTLLGKLLQHTARLWSQPLISTNKICDIYQQHGIEAIMERHGFDNSHATAYIYDDLGSERIPVNYMGNPLNVMERIILNRYELKKHYLTHFTSNLQGDEIEKLYGSRVRSRLREMVNILQLTGTDRRK